MASLFTTSKNVTTKVPFGGDVRTPFYLQFVPGIVVDTITHPSVYKGYDNSDLINSITAIPHITEDTKKRRLNLNEDDRYFPLMRGIFEVPAKGDPVLLCEIGGIKYYLGPLNTQNNPNWNTDNLYSSEPTIDNIPSVSETNPILASGESLNFQKIKLNRFAKRSIKKLDGEDAYNETHGDIMLEGRHGNSIRVGSRNTNPYVFISNARASQYNIQETLFDGSLISITEKGSLFDHFGSVVETINSNTEDGTEESFQTDGFKLSSDTIEPDKINRLMEALVSSVNNDRPSQEEIYQYGNNENQNQMLFSSDRIIINTKNDDIYLSSKKDIHIGTGRHLTISSNEDLIVESEKTFLGNPKTNEMESMVLGNTLIEVLQETLTVLKEAQGLCTGAPIPLVDSTMTPLSTKVVQIEQKLNNIISNKHFIEQN